MCASPRLACARNEYSVARAGLLDLLAGVPPSLLFATHTMPAVMAHFSSVYHFLFCFSLHVALWLVFLPPPSAVHSVGFNGTRRASIFMIGIKRDLR